MMILGYIIGGALFGGILGILEARGRKRTEDILQAENAIAEKMADAVGRAEKLQHIQASGARTARTMGEAPK